MAASWEDIEQWRRWAEELHAIADHFSIPSAQDKLRRAAEFYDALAAEAEEQLAAGASSR